MYEVSNSIAYDGLMVYGKADQGGGYGLVDPDIWTHVLALPGKDKCNAAEDAMADLLLLRISRRLWERARTALATRRVCKA
jgi:hypothetical protein